MIDSGPMPSGLASQRVPSVFAAALVTAVALLTPGCKKKPPPDDAIADPLLR